MSVRVLGSSARRSIWPTTARPISAAGGLRNFNTRPASQPAEPFKILFCGSDEFSTASLKAVLEAEDVWQSITVLTPHQHAVARRGRKMYYSPLKLFALDNGLTTVDVPPTGLKGDYSFPAPFTTHHPAHLLLTASFGHIIPTPLLEPFGHALNVHPSLLPKYRGAAPIQWAIANGDKSTGVTVQTVGKREAGVDSGAILGAVDGLPIPPNATYHDLLPELSHIGGRTLVAVLRQLMRGTATPRVQSGNVVRAPKITTETTRVDWSMHPELIAARHRGFGHHTPLWTTVSFETAEPLTIQLLEVSVTHDPPRFLAKFAEAQPGTAVLDHHGRRVLVSTTPGAPWVEITRVKPIGGKKDIPAFDWWKGLPPGPRKAGLVMFS